MNHTKRKKMLLGAAALVVLVVTRSKPRPLVTASDDALQPNYDPAEPNHVDGFGDVTWVGDYGYFNGGYIEPSGTVVYTGQVEELPWYLSWGAGWLF